MSSLFNPPKSPAPPPPPLPAPTPPTAASPEVQMAGSRESGGAGAMGGTLLTGPRGLVDQASTTKKATFG